MAHSAEGPLQSVATGQIQTLHHNREKASGLFITRAIRLGALWLRTLVFALP